MQTRAKNIPDQVTAQGIALDSTELLHPFEPRTMGGLHLIKSKLTPPLLAAACINRPSLLARIDAGSRRKVVLLAAPIGSGKTTLLTQWYRHAIVDRAVAWLSLDEGDSEPLRFFSYLIDAVRSAVPGFDACLPSCGAAPDVVALRAATTVSEYFGRIRQQLAIVLDDSQWLAAPSLLRSIDFVLQRSPENIHWIISGRRMPELNMTPFRLSDQLTMLAAADLSLDSAQILQLSRKLCRRPLSGAEVDCIKSRTEGWAAGVKLALLAAPNPGGPNDALHEFAGSHPEVARYFDAAVLQGESAEMREFLIASSIVDRMTGELCDALAGISHSQSLLHRLERSQLFIQSLDGHARWYRYHTLFRDYLRSGLRLDAARIPALHERASRWFAEHQLYEEALQHAFAGTNTRWRSELVARCVRTWLYSGEIADVIRWCERLPRTEVIGHEEICAAYISSLILSRRFPEAVIALREMELWAAAGHPVNPTRLRLLRLMWSILSDSSGDNERADDVLDTEGADNFLSGTLLTLQAYATLRRHRFDAAWRLAMRACDTFEKISVYGYGYANAVAWLAERGQGDMKSAAKRCEQMYAMVRGGRRNPAWVNAATALAHVRYEENRLAEAEALCAEVLPLLCVASTIENFTTAYMTLARIKAASGRAEEAFRLLDYLHSVLESGCHRRFLAQVCGEKIRLCLAQDKLARARAIAVEFGVPQLAESGAWQSARSYDEAWERFGYAHVSLLMQENDYARSRAILTVLRDSARAVGYVYREVPLEAALANCAWDAGDRGGAFEALNRGLALTGGQGYSRSVFDETAALAQIVAAAIKQRKLSRPLPSRYLCRFEDLFGTRAGDAAAPKRKAARPLEPLTDREIDMLKLLASGLSNQAISAHSQIALSTAKWHLKNVFAKLGVSTRTGAIVRARELRLID